MNNLSSLNRKSADAQRMPFNIRYVLQLMGVVGALCFAFLFVSPTYAQLDSLTPETIAMDAVVKVWVISAGDLHQLQYDFDVWDHGNHDLNDPWVLVRVTPAEYTTLLKMGRRVEIDQNQTARLNQPRIFDATQLAGIPGYSCYRTVEETFTTLDTLNATYPNLVELVDLGDTWEKTQNAANGYDIRGIVITNEAIGGTKPKLMIMAATHAREYATAEMATRFVEHVLQNYGVDPDITWMLDYFELHVVPQANPDGRKMAENISIWHRKNVNTAYCSASNKGVDLNRNMSWAWLFGISNTCSDSYQGATSISEPENVAIADYTRAIFPDLRGTGAGDAAPDTLDGVFLTVHSYGEYVLPTWAYTTASTSPNASEIYTLGRKMGYYNNYFVCGTGDSGCLGAAAGTHDDFVYGELGVPSYTIELGTSFHQACSTFENTIYPDNLNAFLYTFKAARRPYQTPSGPEVTAINVTPANMGITSTNGITLTSHQAITLTVTVDDTRYDSNGGGVEPTQNIVEVRYSIDAPSWMTGTVLTTLNASDGAFDSPIENATIVIPTLPWMPSKHTIFVEGKDADGNWGVPTAYFVTVTAFPTGSVFLPIVVNDGANGTTDLPFSAETLSILLSTTLLGSVTVVSTRRRDQIIK
ncbi:MAG: M14 family zinc carboxypeptidase [Candidatus Promineifilaceae bacterium]